MPTIEQVSKRLTSDNAWFSKCMLGVFLSVIPIVHFLPLGYLFRLFRQGRRQEPLSLLEWGEDWKRMWLDGVLLFLFLLVFAGVPIALMLALTSGFEDSILQTIAMAPVLFFSGPLALAALYLYLLDRRVKNCLNYQAILGLLKRAAPSFWAPTLALWGLLLMLPFAFFLGGAIYFYLMGYIFKNVELRTDT